MVRAYFELRQKKDALSEQEDQLKKEFKKNSDDLNHELDEVRDKQKEIILGLGSSIENVKILQKLAKSKQIDEKTKKVISKVLNVIASQYKENNNKR